MNFWWEITNLIQLDLNHSLKWMQYRPKLVDEDEDMVVVIEEIPNTMVLMVIIHQILKKKKKKTLLHHQKWNNIEAKQEP